MKQARMLSRGMVISAVLLALAVVLWAWRTPSAPAALTPAEMADLHASTPLPRPESGLAVYHLGHSLVGPNIPAFTRQLAEAAGFSGARYHRQLGWGTSLRDHWDRDRPINGFAEMNTPPSAHRAPHEALASGEYDALILTEMVELRDAIRWHASGAHAAKWTALARAHRPDIRVFLYETWHATDTPEGWLARLDADLPALWQGTIKAEAMAQPDTGVIHLIPAGQAMAAFARALEAQGGLPGLADYRGLFSLREDGTRDTIHPNDLGSYLVALVHVATLYQTDPRGLPYALLRSDGSAAEAPSPEVAALMQSVVWDVVRSLPQTGLQP